MNQRLPVFAERNSYPHLYLQLYQIMSAVQQPAFSSSEALFTINNYMWIYMYTRTHQRMRMRSSTAITGHASYSGSGCGLDQATPTYDTSVPLGFKILARTLPPTSLDLPTFDRTHPRNIWSHPSKARQHAILSPHTYSQVAIRVWA